MVELGGEYGTVTGRRRRCGWLDLVALRYAARINGLTGLFLTKLDILSHFESIRVAVAYTSLGERYKEFPRQQRVLYNCVPVYEDLPAGRATSAGRAPTTISQGGAPVHRVHRGARRGPGRVGIGRPRAPADDLQGMKTLLVGGGGREHALAWAMRDGSLGDLLLLPGNPGCRPSATGSRASSPPTSGRWPPWPLPSGSIWS